jgi:inosose dehydratase
MKLSVFYDHLIHATEISGKSIYELFDICKKNGISGLDIQNEYAFKESPRYAEIKMSGMSVACSYQFYDFNGDEYKRCDRIKAHIENAASFSQDKIMVVPGFLTHEEAAKLRSVKSDPESLYSYMNASSSMQKITEMLAFAVEYGKKHGVTVTLEDYDDIKSPCAYIGTLKYFTDTVDGLKITLDTGNFSYSDEDILAAYDTFKDRIVHTHIKDRGIQSELSGNAFNKGQLPVTVGDGYLPISKVIEKLKKDGYNGYFTVEQFGKESPEDIQRAAFNLKNMLQIAH